MERNIEVLIRDLAVRSTGDENAVRYEDFGERQCLESDFFQEIPLGQDWLFRSATEEEACTLLTSFVSGALDVGPGLGCELTRLLAEKGSVVKEQLQNVIEGTDWSRYGTPCRVLAGLHFLPDGKRKTMELLNISGDCRGAGQQRLHGRYAQRVRLLDVHGPGGRRAGGPECGR